MSYIDDRAVPDGYFMDALANAKMVYEDQLRYMEARPSSYVAYLYDASEMEMPAPLLCYFEAAPQDDGCDLLLESVFCGRTDVTWLIRTAGLVDDITAAAYRDAAREREQSRTENRIAAMEGA